MAKYKDGSIFPITFLALNKPCDALVVIRKVKKFGSEYPIFQLQYFDDDIINMYGYYNIVGIDDGCLMFFDPINHDDVFVRAVLEALKLKASLFGFEECLSDPNPSVKIELPDCICDN